MNVTDTISRRLDTWDVCLGIKRTFPKHLKRTIQPWRSLQASQDIWTRMNRVRILGEDNINGSHSGCINALHWSSDGSILVSAGDDTRIHLWLLNSSLSKGINDYPLECTAKINTGHTGNIFSAHTLGNSTRIATCAADSQVRVFDVNHMGLYHHSGGVTEYQEQTCIKVFKCHRGRVKRIVTEGSPDHFLTVSEDGSIRQHDLRSPHRCSHWDNSCPTPLLSLPFELSTISMSRLTPYNFVAAGQSPYAFVFDRRHIARRIKEEWGVNCTENFLASCVRRLGRRSRGENELPGSEHITGSRMSQENGHELLLSYSSDAVYLYSIRDCPDSPTTFPYKHGSVLPANTDSPLRRLEIGKHTDSSETEEGSETTQVDGVDSDALKLPIVYPRRKYVGVCNVETVKDVNFIGLQDNLVVSGSDDGNFFIWDKPTGNVLDIHEGDSSIVNVIEQHPFLPVLAVSGIDDTVKIFAPSIGERSSSRMSRKEEIVANNREQLSPRLTRRRAHMSRLLLRYREELLAGGQPPEDVECVYQ